MRGCSRFIFLAALLSNFVFHVFSQVDPEYFMVELSAMPNVSPAELRLEWTLDTNATGYALSRRASSEADWSLLANLPGSASEFADTNVSLGAAYEYEILKSTSSDYIGSGYLYGGVEVSPVEKRGSVLLLIDSRWKFELAPEIKRLQQDLIGDGWTIITRYISETASVAQVKALIQSIYSNDPSNIRALFLFGHIPVPYSGNYTADTHENHTGAWPADSFYGDMDGVWTDSEVNNSNAEKEWNHNIPGDGKFDPSEIPSDLELEVGRVDLSNLTCFSNKTPPRDELALLRQYLNKDHAFRQGQLLLPRRGLICYNFEDDAEGLRSVPLRAYAPLFGASTTLTVPWGAFFPTVRTNGFLFAYGAGGGSYYTCAGIGSSDDFALNDLQAVFTFFFGSYFGDWDNESNFLRAALGSTSYTLASAWAGRPYWFVHPMALGETIGYATRLTQNNGTNGFYQPLNMGTRAVHIALMGDPTLRLHPVLPPTDLIITETNSGFSLSWAESTDENLLGYYVYRADSEAGPFTRISGSTPLQETSFDDPEGTASTVYMVRTVKLENSASGTYYNLSQGAFVRPYPLPEAPSSLQGSANATTVTLSWQDNATNETGFHVYRQVQPSGPPELIGSLGMDSASFQDTSVLSGAAYTYTLSAFNQAGESSSLEEVTLTIPGRANVAFVGFDPATEGSWKGTYGMQGHNITEDSFSYPPYVNVVASGQSSWVWNWSTTDGAALERATESTRLAACWYAFSPFEIQLSFLDTDTHRASLYFLDWDTAGRVETIDVVDADNGTVLSSQTISNFQNGVYATFDLQGNLTIRLTPVSGNAVLSGIFFDSPLPTAAPPVFSPSEGKYTNSVEVTITSATADAEVRYTLDGTLPTESSLLYNSPFTLTNTTTVKARTFKTEMNPSSVTMEKYTIITPTGPPVASVAFNGIDTSRQGSWKGAIGAEGYALFQDSTSLPSYVTVTTSGKSDWIWEYATDDPRALERQTDSSRMASCWYASSAFDVAFNFKDQEPHRVSFYCLDWDLAGREQTIEVIDTATDQVLHSYELTDFGAGVYLDYSITGPVVVRLTKVTSYNAVCSGFFFDPAPSP